MKDIISHQYIGNEVFRTNTIEQGGAKVQKDATIAEKCEDVLRNITTNQKGQCLLQKDELGLVRKMLLKCSIDNEEKFCEQI